jgi:hypothetical protein
MDKTANMSEGKERYLAEIDHVLHQTSIHKSLLRFFYMPVPNFKDNFFRTVNLRRHFIDSKHLKISGQGWFNFSGILLEGGSLRL